MVARLTDKSTPGENQRRKVMGLKPGQVVPSTPSHDCQTAEQGKTSENWRRKVMGLHSAVIILLNRIARLPKSAFPFNPESLVLRYTIPV
jgi:hypothetical protein